MLDDFSFSDCRSAADLLTRVAQKVGIEDENEYYDRKSGLSREDYKAALNASSTIYVGSLPFNIGESTLQTLFSALTPHPQSLNRLVMGINRKTNKPCGFCFVEYTFKEDADLVRNVGPVLLTSRTLTFDQDIGFKHGRQYGRGKLGG